MKSLNRQKTMGCLSWTKTAAATAKNNNKVINAYITLHTLYPYATIWFTNTEWCGNCMQRESVQRVCVWMMCHFTLTHFYRSISMSLSPSISVRWQLRITSAASIDSMLFSRQLGKSRIRDDSRFVAKIMSVSELMNQPVLSYSYQQLTIYLK